jgi:hypothetical protein
MSELCKYTFTHPITEGNNWLDLLSAEELLPHSPKWPGDVRDASAAISTPHPEAEILSDCMWSLDAKEPRQARCRSGLPDGLFSNQNSKFG